MKSDMICNFADCHNTLFQRLGMVIDVIYFLNTETPQPESVARCHMFVCSRHPLMSVLVPQDWSHQGSLNFMFILDKVLKEKRIGQDTIRFKFPDEVLQLAYGKQARELCFKFILDNQ